MKRSFSIILFTLLLFFCQTSTYASSGTDKADNIILLIGDGMGMGQIEVARQFEYGKEGKLNMERMDHTALMRTYSAGSMVTDSAAGGSAIATGVKTLNGMLGVDEKGRETDSILDILQAAGKKTGLITTSMAVDATPAAFGASTADRWTGSASIASQLADSEIDVIMGGGESFFKHTQGRGELMPVFQKKGYTIVRDKKQLVDAPSGGRLLGLFNSSYMNYVLDRKHVHSAEPSLPEMLEKSLQTLSKGKHGFFLMAEGGRIDHASHAADLTGVWKETIEFDQTVKRALDFTKTHPNTLVIVLADHETMGISVPDQLDIKGLKNIKASPVYMAGQLEKKGIQPATVREVFQEWASISLTDAEIGQFIEKAGGSRSAVYKQSKLAWEIGSQIAAHYKAGIMERNIRNASPTGGHTANMVPVFAKGPGSGAFHGVLDNTDISALIMKAAGINFVPGPKNGS